MITPAKGWMVDPNNPNGVIQEGSVPSPLAARYAPITGNTKTPSGAVVNTETGALVTPPPSGAATAAPATPSPLEQATTDYYNGLPKGPVDENAVREKVRQQMQGQIDSVNVLYNNLAASQAQANTGQYNRVRALNTASGLQGSDFASANAQGAEDKGNAAMAALERERQAKVSEVLGNIDARATQQITDEKNKAQSNLKEYVDYLGTRQTQARDDIKTLAQSGVTIDAMDPETYQKLLKQSGYDDFTLRTVYNNARSAATKIDYQWKTVGNKLFGYGVDPLTGQISSLEKDLPASDVPPNYKPQVLDNGTIVFYPETIDPSKPVKDQIITYDSGYRKDTRTAGQKDDALSAGRLKQVTPAVAALRDSQSGYVDPQAFSDLYQTYVDQNPGKGKEFLDQFPVSVYIDPSERYKFSNSGY